MASLGVASIGLVLGLTLQGTAAPAAGRGKIAGAVTTAAASASASADPAASASAAAVARAAASDSAQAPGPPPAAARELAPPVASVAEGSRAPAAQGSALGAEPGAEVAVLGQGVFTFLVAHAGHSPTERALEARQALERAAADARAADVAVERRGELAVIMVRGSPTIHLGEEDARAAGSASADALAATVAERIRAALDTERRRDAMSRVLLSVSLVIGFGLIALVLVRLVRRFAANAQAWLEAHEDRVPGLTVRSIEVIHAGVVRAGARIGLAVASWIVQLGIAYAWLVFALSRFDSTRGYTSRMAGFVLTPLASMLERLATTVPLAIVGLVAATALVVLLRFLALYFAAVGRGEAQVSWVKPEHAATTSLLVRLAVVILALVFLGPVVTGDREGPLTVVGGVALAVVGLALTPLVASALIGALQLFTQRLYPGMYVAVGAVQGRVTAVNLLELRLSDALGRETRVPYLVTLIRPLRVLGDRRRVAAQIGVPAGSDVAGWLVRLRDAAATVGEFPQAELVALGATSHRVRISVMSERPDARSALLLAVAGEMGRGGGAPPLPPRPSLGAR